MQGIEAADRHGAALHVDMHVEHALVGLQIGAAGVEADPLAHQAHGAQPLPCTPSASRSGRKARRTIPASRVALPCDTARKAPAPSRFSCALAVELEPQPQPPRELREQPAVARRVEGIRRQRGQPSRQVVARGRGQSDVEAGELRPGQVDARRRAMRLGIALERRELKCRGLQRSDQGLHRGGRRKFGAAPGAYQQGFGFAFQRCPGDPPCGLQHLEGPLGRAEAGRQNQSLRPRADAHLDDVAGFARLAAIQIPHRRWKGQRLPDVRIGGLGQQDHDACITPECRLRRRRPQLANRDQERTEGQANRHIH